jgi:hypothetical protein
MNMTFSTKYDDFVALHLVNKNLMNIDFAYTSINVILNNARNQYAPSSEQFFPYKDHNDAINIDECITLTGQVGCEVFDALTIKNQDIAKLLPVLVTDLTSPIKISN